jgi:hypothetical protein
MTPILNKAMYYCAQYPILSHAPGFLQVKVKNWVDGTEGTTVVGLTAAFGASLPANVQEARKTFSVLTDPLDCCSNLTTKVQFRHLPV